MSNNNEGRDSGIQAVGQLIAAVAALLWEVFGPRNDKGRS